MKARGKTIRMILMLVFSLPLFIGGSPVKDDHKSSPSDRLGPIYPIIEPDWLEWLPKQAERRLKEKPLTLSKDQVKQTVQRQMPEITLPEVKVARTYYIDPSVRVSQPVSDHTGKILVPAGGSINPLEHLPGFQPILIIDGRKKRQVEWVRKISTKMKPIVLVTEGDIFELNTKMGLPVYPAPQAIIDRFSIVGIPVVVTREGDRLKVEEVVL